MRFTELLGIKFETRSGLSSSAGTRDAAASSHSLLPPRRPELPTDEEAVSLSSVYRAISILSTAAAQLPLYVERNGRRLPAAETPGIIRQPNMEMSRGDFVETLVNSMAFTGNAYFQARGELRGAPAELVPLDPRRVSVGYDHKRKRIIYYVDAKEAKEGTIGHCRLLTLPGRLTGLSPIDAARKDIAGALATRNIASSYFDDSGQPTGILASDQDLTEDEARAIINAYNHLDADGNPLDIAHNPSRVKVLPKGIKYQPLTVKPSDAQWIETRKFDTTTIARLFGVPASLMLAAVEGSSMTYQNIEQEWISFARFTLTQYTRKIEDELTRMTVRGQRVKFNFEGMLRADTKTRYEAYAIALDKGFMTINEIRDLEDLTPLEN